jgi:hypothetical protein
LRCRRNVEPSADALLLLLLLGVVDDDSVVVAAPAVDAAVVSLLWLVDVIVMDDDDVLVMDGRCNGNGREAMGRPSKDDAPWALGNDLTFFVIAVGGDLS